MKVRIKPPSLKEARDMVTNNDGTMPRLDTVSGIERILRRREALELRRKGKSYTKIALIMDITVTEAARMVNEELLDLRQHTDEDVETVMQMELIRLDHWLECLQTGIDAGDPQAIVSALRIQERRSRLMGLDAPAKSASLSITAQLSPEKVAQMTNEELQSAIKKLFLQSDKARLTPAEPIPDIDVYADEE